MNVRAVVVGIALGLALSALVPLGPVPSYIADGIFICLAFVLGGYLVFKRTGSARGDDEISTAISTLATSQPAAKASLWAPFTALHRAEGAAPAPGIFTPRRAKPHNGDTAGLRNRDQVYFAEAGYPRVPPHKMRLADHVSSLVLLSAFCGWLLLLAGCVARITHALFVQLGCLVHPGARPPRHSGRHPSPRRGSQRERCCLPGSAHAPSGCS